MNCPEDSPNIETWNLCPDFPRVIGDLQDVEATVLWLSCLDEKSEVLACNTESLVEMI